LTGDSVGLREFTEFAGAGMGPRREALYWQEPVARKAIRVDAKPPGPPARERSARLLLRQ
jgi:hypothetical protein